MVPIDWAAPALADLQEVHDFIARDSPRYAQETVERIQEAVTILERFPELGWVLPEFPQGRHREILVGAYRVIYRYEKKRKRVLIVAVVQGSRDLPPILKGR